MLGIFFLVSLCVVHAKEVLVPLPNGGHVALSTRGPSAFRVRFLFDSSSFPIDTTMVYPDQPDAAFQKITNGISSTFGSVVVDSSGILQLLDAQGNIITKTTPLGSSDICAAIEADVSSADRVADPMTVSDEAACCDACKNNQACTNWIYGHPGDAEGNCWLVKNPTGIHASSSRTLGGPGIGQVISFSTNNAALYGRGAGAGDATSLTATSVTPHVENRETYVPHYYSTDGYAALGVVNVTTGYGKTNYFPAQYSSDGNHITWSYSSSPFELYLMPAKTLDLGTAAYYALTGAARVPPRYAFGFIASRWGWQDRNYIESVLADFRSGQYPIDAFITDFGWFTNVSDYDFSSQGEPWYQDFGYFKDTFPDPRAQLAHYRDDLHFRMGGIRKPRLGNSDLIAQATQKGWILPGGEFNSKLGYADGRNLNYSIPAVREWYAEQQAHYMNDGVSFFWNDEGETNYFTFFWWNVAQLDSLRATNATSRFFSINRAWTPGMARLGATAWTGDINPTWDDLQKTPGMVLNWGLAGAPYVSCDIGGFTSQTQADLLTRWYQVGIFMPVMRVHSTKEATPHFPWLWGDNYAAAMRQALNLRYQLIPYHYSLAHEMYNTGRLWMRPLVAEFPDDSTAAPISSQWLDGDLLVAPVLDQNSQKDIYLPSGTWYAFNTGSVTQGPTRIQDNADLTEIPVFVRSGAIIPLAPVIQYSEALPGGALQVQVYAGADGSFTLVEDDGSSTAYESARVRSTKFSWNDDKKTLSWQVSDNSGGASLENCFTQVYATMFDLGGHQDSSTVDLGDSGSLSF